MVEWTLAQLAATAHRPFFYGFYGFYALNVLGNCMYVGGKAPHLFLLSMIQFAVPALCL